MKEKNVYIESILNKAIKDKERGMGKYELDISEDAIEFISRNADGDARSALNALELAILTTDISTDGKIHIDINIISECIQKKVLKYDKDGNGHYDTISAFIKMRKLISPRQALIKSMNLSMPISLLPKLPYRALGVLYT